jgi:hypothetical protein
VALSREIEMKKAALALVLFTSPALAQNDIQAALRHWRSYKARKTAAKAGRN